MQQKLTDDRVNTSTLVSDSQSQYRTQKRSGDKPPRFQTTLFLNTQSFTSSTQNASGNPPEKEEPFHSLRTTTL